MKYKKASNPLPLVTPFCVHLPIAQGHEHLVNKDTPPWKSLRHWRVEHNPFLGVPHCNSWDYLGFHKIEKWENNTVRTSEDPLLTKGCTFCFVWSLDVTKHTQKAQAVFSLHWWSLCSEGLSIAGMYNYRLNSSPAFSSLRNSALWSTTCY